jgi:hypothetical protein
MQDLAPILVFGYNRPAHLLDTLKSLSENSLASASSLFIKVDGPRNEADRVLQAEIIARLKEASFLKIFKTIEISTAEKNSGLATSIIAGVTNLVESHGKVIVLEDDMLTSPSFLKFMNDGISKYEHSESVVSIHGYCLNVDTKLPDTFFLKGADCWGWSTWKSGWAHFEVDGSKLLKEIRSRHLEKEFNFNHTYDYVGMLEAQIRGEKSSWAIRWYASAFLKNKLTLYPGESLVRNFGFDGSGTHCGLSNEYDTILSTKSSWEYPSKLEQLGDGYRAYCHFFRKHGAPLHRRVLSLGKKVVKKSLIRVGLWK